VLLLVFAGLADIQQGIGTLRPTGQEGLGFFRFNRLYRGNNRFQNIESSFLKTVANPVNV
jgi:hypothetical protein